MANEIPASDEELDALMAELEASTGVSAVAATPAPKATPAPASEVSDEELDELELDGGLHEKPAQPEPVVPVPTPEATDEGAVVMEDDDGSTFVLPASLSGTPATTESNVDDDLAALEAEIASGTVAPPETPPWQEQPAALSDADILAVAGAEMAKIGAAQRAHLEKSIAAAKAAGEDVGELEEAMRNFQKGRPTPEPEPTKPAPAPKPTPISAEEEEALAEAVKKKAKASLDFYIDVDEFKRDMQVTETNLDNCMMTQASMRAYHGAVAARAEAQAASIKARFDVREAQLYAHHRKEFAKAGEKATEKAIENAVKLDPKWIAGKIMVIEAESIAAVAKACVGALADRRDMVIQLGADRRDESKGQVRIMAAQAERDHLANRAVNAARAANS
jgi:hypothetical protein